MNQIQKFLRKLPKAELQRISMIINQLEKKDLAGLDVKKLSGRKDIFRVRSGSTRLLFFRSKNGYRLISIERRNDTTYNL